MEARTSWEGPDSELPPKVETVVGTTQDKLGFTVLPFRSVSRFRPPGAAKATGLEAGSQSMVCSGEQTKSVERLGFVLKLWFCVEDAAWYQWP